MEDSKDARRRRSSSNATIDANCGEIAALIRDAVLCGDMDIRGKGVMIYTGIHDDGSTFNIWCDWPMKNEDWGHLGYNKPPDLTKGNDYEEYNTNNGDTLT